MEQFSHFIEIEQIQIILDTNIPNNPAIPLTLSLLNFENGSDQTYSQLPFFTSSCQFPIDLLMKMTYSQIIQFFFNKDIFTKTINKCTILPNGKGHTERVASSILTLKGALHPEEFEQPSNIIQTNVMVMLQYLLPTYPFSNQLFSSYDMITSINQKKTAFFQNNVPNSSGSKATFRVSSEEAESPLPKIITFQDKKYNIKKVIWLNDLINQPKYAQFIDNFDKFMYWKNATKIGIKKQLDQLFLDKDIVKTIEHQINLMFKIDIQIRPKSKYNVTYNYKTHIDSLNEQVIDYKIVKTQPTDPDVVSLPNNLDNDTLLQILEPLFFLMRIKYGKVKGFTSDDDANYVTNKTDLDTYYILMMILEKYFDKFVNFSFDTDESDIKNYMKTYYGQYNDFKKHIGEFVKPNFESTNMFFQTEIDHFINGKPNHFEKYMNMVKRLRNNTKPEMFDEEVKNFMYVGASIQSSSKKSEFQNIINETPKYEIFVSIDVESITKSKDDIDITKNVINIKDTIQNQANKIKIKCNQQNDHLVQIFQSLKEGKSMTNFNLRTNRKMLKLKDSAKKKGGNTTHLRKRIYRNKTMKLYM
jgi:hypothetical protein